MKDVRNFLAETAEARRAAQAAERADFVPPSGPRTSRSIRSRAQASLPALARPRPVSIGRRFGRRRRALL